MDDEHYEYIEEYPIHIIRLTKNKNIVIEWKKLWMDAQKASLLLPAVAVVDPFWLCCC
jgi:hypothetical protein